VAEETARMRETKLHAEKQAARRAERRSKRKRKPQLKLTNSEVDSKKTGETAKGETKEGRSEGG
jgi:hypothetical protein